MKPPLELAVEVTSADGTVTRWDGNARSARNVPTGITFNTKRGDGFSDGPQIVLNRRIDRDYPDINLYDDVKLILADGSIVYQGYVAANPRVFDGNHSVSVRVAGPMTLAQLRPFSEVYVDRDLSKWQAASSLRWNATVVSLGYSPAGPTVQSDPNGSASVTTEASGTWTLASRPLIEAWYTAPQNVTLGKLYYEWTKGINVDATSVDWGWEAILSQDDQLTAFDTTGSLRAAGPGSGTLSATTIDRAYALVRLFFDTGPSGGDNTLYDIFWRNLAAIGNHGLALQSSTTAGPGGFYASDMITDICDRFCPGLDSSGVQQTTYAIDHATFEQSLPYDAWLALNSYHLWELACWEGGAGGIPKLCYYPADLTDYDWQVRFDDPGVTIDVPGDSTEALANGAVVSYLDIQTNTTKVLDPNNTPSLADPNPLNPATLHGKQAWTQVDLTAIPLSAADATQLGAAKLAEYNQAKAAGTITVTGHIRDRAGNWQPASKVRASDTIAIVNHPNDRPRLIGETSWDQDSLKCTIAVDNTLNRVDAWLDRTATALKAANVASGV